MASSQVPQIFNRRAAAAKWARAIERQTRKGAASYLSASIAEDMADRLDFMRFEGKSAFVIGDTVDALPFGIKRPLGSLDEELPGAFEEYDLVAHILGLGVVNDLPGALIHARNSLCEGGLFIAGLPGAGSLPALRQIVLAADGERPAARMHPLVDNRAGTALLERAGFSRQVVDSYPLKVRFSSLGQLISDLRDHGLTRSLKTPVPPLSRDWLARAEAAFDAMREEDGKVTETFEILVLTGWR
ncbi:methyltransferase [Erythrobacter sp. SCSIO 43205]|uniref:methyltransferase n=1 Tax=Erythrobacter sp. SCSIO 43205 TaxID=2779361 RepID=UPI001CA8195D|nr:methyltransferase [Erythrobacter sp. SCSIO 43205]UAB77118.1 methyltransferase [Erythrobacter sp. SCSIO 43205]